MLEEPLAFKFKYQETVLLEKLNAIHRPHRRFCIAVTRSERGEVVLPLQIFRGSSHGRKIQLMGNEPGTAEIKCRGEISVQYCVAVKLELG